MARWVKGLHEGAVISPSSWTQLNTFIPTTTPPTTGFGWYGYGLGIRLGSYYGKTVKGHTGSIMGYISITGYIPRTGASFAVLFNASEATTTNTITITKYTGTGKEVVEVVDACNVEPEHGVQCVV